MTCWQRSKSGSQSHQSRFDSLTKLDSLSLDVYCVDCVDWLVARALKPSSCRAQRGLWKKATAACHPTHLYLSRNLTLSFQASNQAFTRAATLPRLPPQLPISFDMTTCLSVTLSQLTAFSDRVYGQRAPVLRKSSAIVRFRASRWLFIATSPLPCGN